jgi:hypothetical protein
MSFIDAFFGSTQSQFTAYAIFAAVVSICISIILTGTDMTIGNRFLLIFFVILSVLPSILLMLLQITCMVTGGTKDDRWWCWLYSWIIAIFVIIYCILVVIISLSSLFTYNNAISKVDMSEQNNKMSPENSNNYAKIMINSNTPEAIEKFMNAEEEEQEQEQDITMIQEFENKLPQGYPKKLETFAEEKAMKIPSTIPTEKPDKQQSTSIEPVLNEVNKPEYTTKKEESYPTNPADKVTEKYSSTEMIEDEFEPFTNRNYASFR